MRASKESQDVPLGHFAKDWTRPHCPPQPLALSWVQPLPSPSAQSFSETQVPSRRTLGGQEVGTVRALPLEPSEALAFGHLLFLHPAQPTEQGHVTGSVGLCLVAAQPGPQVKEGQPRAGWGLTHLLGAPG